MSNYATLFGSDNIPRFMTIAGSGAAWVNLWHADTAIKKKNEWHQLYSLYCVGEHSKPRDLREQARHQFKDNNGQVHDILAIE
jgi:hypothetical protein